MKECRCRTLKVALQKQANAVVVPALPVGLLGDYFRGLSRRAFGKNPKYDRIFGEKDNRQIRDLFDFTGDGRGVAIKCKLTVVIRASCLRAGRALLRLPTVRKVGVPPGKLAVAQARRKRNLVSCVRRDL